MNLTVFRCVKLPSLLVLASEAAEDCGVRPSSLSNLSRSATRPKPGRLVLVELEGEREGSDEDGDFDCERGDAANEGGEPTTSFVFVLSDGRSGFVTRVAEELADVADERGKGDEGCPRCGVGEVWSPMAISRMEGDGHLLACCDVEK